MGKWTSSHYDDVLNAKIKSLVSGAITRSRLEKSDPVISYESFVEELDAGDSFTTSVVDILVKELAERRTRHSITDRRLIADRTAKNLRTLATSVRIYRDRRHLSRRLEHLASPPGEMGMQDDDDEFDNILASEGIRVNSDLYEAYSGHSAWANAIFHRRDSPQEDSSSTPPQPPSPPVHSPSLARILTSPPPLTRQPSTRRPQRSRTTDFNDFASRRRSIYRDAVTEDANTGPESSGTRPGQRRFFQFPRHHHRFEGLSSSWTSPWIDDDTDTRPVYPVEPSPSSAAWFYPLPLTPTLSHDSTDTETPEERVLTAPRLRRGGVRPPEALQWQSTPTLESESRPVETTAGSSSAQPAPRPLENENS